MNNINFGDIAFTLPSELEKNNDDKDFIVTNCGYYIEHNRAHTYYAVDDNNQYLLLYNHLGEISMTVGKQTQTIPPHSILIFPPNQLRHYKFLKSETSERYYVYFKGTQATEYLEKMKLANQRFFLTPNLSSIIPVFKNIISDFRVHDFDTEIYRTSMLLQILTTISLAIEKRTTPINPIAPALEYIQQNYHKNITLDDLMQGIFMSTNAFIYTFKKITGKTPIKYLNDFRLNKAQVFLIESDMPITAMAEHLGFSNAAYFSNAFKKTIGVSPATFREQNKFTPPPPFIVKIDEDIHKT